MYRKYIGGAMIGSQYYSKVNIDYCSEIFIIRNMGE